MQKNTVFVLYYRLSPGQSLFYYKDEEGMRCRDERDLKYCNCDRNEGNNLECGYVKKNYYKDSNRKKLEPEGT